MQTPTAFMLQPIMCKMEETEKQDSPRKDSCARNKPFRQLKSAGILCERFHCLHYLHPNAELHNRVGK